MKTAIRACLVLASLTWSCSPAGSDGPSTADTTAGIGAAGSGATIQPTLQSIYDNVLHTSCVSCHNKQPGNRYAGSQMLDFTSIDTAYATLVGQPTYATGACGGQGQVVAPGNCMGSVLFQKVSSPTCGARMPLGGGMLPGDAVNAICTWIGMGALK